MKRMLGVLMVLAMLVLVFQLAWAEPVADQAAVRVASLKGPTSMGLVKLMKDEGDKGNYTFTVAGTADEIAPLLAKGELDIALIPCNLASVLWNKTGGKLNMAAINTLGVLYVIEKGESVASLEDMKGKTLLSTGKGTTPEYALNYVLGKSGIDPNSDLNIEFKSEATEVAAAMAQGQGELALLPQPFATTVIQQNPDLRVALSLSDVWDEVGDGSALVTGVVVVRSDWLAENRAAFDSFMAQYAQSTDYGNRNPAEVAPWIEELGIAKAAVAEVAIPLCNIVCITGDDMKQKASGYLGALYEQNPESVGGKLPDETFYLE